MRRRLCRVTRVLLAATASIFTSLLAFGVSAAAAVPPPYSLRFQYAPSAAPASATTFVVATVLLAAIISAIVVHGALTERSEQRALTAQVMPLPVDREQTRTRNAA